MSTLHAQLANLKAENERLRAKLRDYRSSINRLTKYKGELEECLSRARERGWDELSRVLHETPAPGEEEAKKRALRRSGVAA